MLDERLNKRIDYGTHTAKLILAEVGYGKINGTKQLEVIYEIVADEREVNAYYCLEPVVSDWYLRCFLERLGYNGSGMDMQFLPNLIEEISADQPICEIQLRSDGSLITAELLRRLSPMPSWD